MGTGVVAMVRMRTGAPATFGTQGCDASALPHPWNSPWWEGRLYDVRSRESTPSPMLGGAHWSRRSHAAAPQAGPCRCMHAAAPLHLHVVEVAATPSRACRRRPRPPRAAVAVRRSRPARSHEFYDTWSPSLSPRVTALLWTRHRSSKDGRAHSSGWRPAAGWRLGVSED